MMTEPAIDMRVRPDEEEIRAFQDAIAFHLTYTLAKRIDEATPRDLFHAMSFAVRQRVIYRMMRTEERYRAAGAKRLYYLSMEFLVGRSLRNNLLNLGVDDLARQAMQALGLDFDRAVDVEPD